MTNLFRDNVSMLVHELLLAHMLPGKIFNLIALLTQYFICTRPNDNCFYLRSTPRMDWDPVHKLDYLNTKSQREKPEGFGRHWWSDVSGFFRVQTVCNNAVHSLKCSEATQLFINLKTFLKPGQESPNQTLPTFAFRLADTHKHSTEGKDKL